MQKSTKIQLGAAVLGVILTTAIVAGITYAAEGTAWRGKGFMGMRGGEKNETVRTALEAGDYTAWLAAMPENSPAKQTTEEDFNKLVEAHELMQAGNIEGAKAIKAELGFKFGPERGEKGGHFPEGKFGGNEAARTALEAGDYTAWLAAMPEDCPMRGEDATEENFNKMVEMHNLIQAGDFEGAQAIADELGLKRPGPGHFMKHGPRGNDDNENEDN